MRSLGIETSTPTGSVALVENQRVVYRLEHDEPSAHAERILPLVGRCLAEAGWRRGDLERIAVGIGPGSFVGLRVGIALAQGLGLGLAIPVLGVGSLQSLAHAVPGAEGGSRLALLDARRDELFAAAYAADGRELLAPEAVPRERARELVLRLGADVLVVGNVAASVDLGAGVRVWDGERALPSADRAALLAEGWDAADHPPLPRYVRGPGATLPNLPPSPFGGSPS